MSDAPDPPRKFYAFKPREFETVNPPVAPPQPPAAPPEPQAMEPPATPAPPDAREIARLATPKGKLLATSSRLGAENDVHAILRDNLAKANAAGLNELTPKPPRKSRRTRDYFLTLGAGNLFFIATILFRPHVAVFAVAGMIILTLGLTWVMWFVMDDY